MIKKLSCLFLTVILFFPVITVKAQTETLRDSVIQFAYNYLNTPYRRGGTSPKAFDCSGFSSFVYKNFGFQLYRTSSDQVKNGIKVDKTELKPGDLVMFKGRNAKANRVGHVGIVVEADDEGRFKFIHASVKNGVKVSSGEQDYYKSRFVTARRIVEDEEQIFPEILTPLKPKPIELKVNSPLPIVSLFKEKMRIETYSEFLLSGIS